MKNLIIKSCRVLSDPLEVSIIPGWILSMILPALLGWGHYLTSNQALCIVVLCAAFVPMVFMFVSGRVCSLSLLSTSGEVEEEDRKRAIIERQEEVLQIQARKEAKRAARLRSITDAKYRAWENERLLKAGFDEDGESLSVFSA